MQSVSPKMKDEFGKGYFAYVFYDKAVMDPSRLNVVWTSEEAVSHTIVITIYELVAPGAPPVPVILRETCPDSSAAA
jgi:hypothetical protein